GSPFAVAERPPTLAEIGAEPLLGFRSGRALEPVEAALRGAGVEPRFAFRSNDNPTMQALVASGIGNAVMPQLTVDERDPRVVVRELGGQVPPRVTATATSPRPRVPSSRPRPRLLDRDRLREVARLVDVQTAEACDSVGEQL